MTSQTKRRNRKKQAKQNFVLSGKNKRKQFLHTVIFVTGFSLIETDLC